ncbi:hypothetical protein AAC387_Pa03g2148 [Persea americana]
MDPTPPSNGCDPILILDFGSQYIHLLTRRLRSLSLRSLCTFSPPLPPTTPTGSSFLVACTRCMPRAPLPYSMGSSPTSDRTASTSSISTTGSNS